MVTCTDMGVLAGNHPEACFDKGVDDCTWKLLRKFKQLCFSNSFETKNQSYKPKYGSFPLKSTFCHEQAIRIVLYAIEKSANRYGRYIEPLISLHLDFFIRVFVRVHFGKIHVKRSCAKIGHALRFIVIIRGGFLSGYAIPRNKSRSRREKFPRYKC